MGIKIKVQGIVKVTNDAVAVVGAGVAMVVVAEEKREMMKTNVVMVSSGIANY